MIRLLFLASLQLWLSSILYAGEVKFPLWTIDSSLLKNATMVVRLRETTIEVKSLNSEELTVHYVITILKGSAHDNGIFTAFYDEYSSIDEFKGSMYDAFGQLIRKFTSDDISDVSAIDDGILYSDHRMKIINPVINRYPVTLEYFSRKTIKRILAYPSFKPQTDYKQSVELATFEIIAREGLFPRFKEVNFPGNVIVTGDGMLTKRWEFRNLKPLEDEPLNPPLGELTPVIFVSPSRFAIKDYSGDFTTWMTFGAWVRSINEGRDVLPPATVQKVREMVKEIVDTVEKARKIFQYLQETTRYVAVGVGIGGIQPETAETVAKLGYGDCKGLVNYMMAMLQSAGIPSYAVLVRAGDDAAPVQRDFPGDQFNHVILCLPIEKDTIWLECTDQKLPFGFLGDFTADRDALLLSPEGGILVHTPVYGKRENTQNRIVRMGIDSLGTATIAMHTVYRGLNYSYTGELLSLSPEKQKEELVKRYSIPGLKVSSLTLQDCKERIPFTIETIDMKITDYATLSGNRMFIPLTLLLDKVNNFTRAEDRKFDLVLRYSYAYTDTLVISLPKGYRVESQPSAFELVTKYGAIRTEAKREGASILFIRNYEREKGVFPPEDYNLFVEFTKKIAKQDGKKIVLFRGD